MSSKLGTLTLDLVTKIGNFVGPIEDSEKQVKISFDNMRKHVNTYGAAVAAIGASTVTALAGMAYATAQQVSELEKFAFRANTTTQDFQKMAVGAQAYGIEQEKLSDMMKDFNEKLGELTTIGAGGGVDFFEQIAMKTEGSSEAAKKLILDMQKLSGPEALQLYVAKLEEAGVSQQQMSFYLESMASDMTDLYPLLANGGEGMDLYADAAERAGLVMSDNTIEQAKILKEQVYLLDLQLQGAKNQLMAAVIPAFVDIADAFFSGSEQGAQFADIAETIGDGLRYVAKVAIGAATAVQLVGKTIGGLAAAGGAIATGDFAGAKAIGSAMIDDLSATALSAAERMDKVTKSTASTTARQLAQVRQLGTSTKGVNAGLDALAKKQDKAAGATSKHSKASSELNRILQEQQRIIRDYSTADRQEEIDLEKEIQRLRENNMAEYIPIAEARYREEKKLREMQNAWELVEHRLTQDQKLSYSYNIKEQEIKADAKLTDQQRKDKLLSLREQYNIEVNEMRISQQKQLLEAKRNWMTAGEYAREYYALVREEILNTSGYSPETKQALLQQAASDENIEQSYERDSAIADYRDVMGYGENPLERQFEVLQKMRELDLLNEEAYQNAKLELQTKYAASYMESMLGGFASLVDENSKTYAVLFAAQKAFAVAQAMLNIPAAYSKAYDAVVGTPYIGPYIAPAVGAAAAALQVAQAASMKSVNLTGMAHDGIDNIPKEGTWLLDKGERVLNPSQNRDLTNYLSQVQTGGQNPPIDNKLSVIMVKDEDEAKNYKYSKDFEDAVLYHMKRNRSKI